MKIVYSPKLSVYNSEPYCTHDGYLSKPTIKEYRDTFNKLIDVVELIVNKYERDLEHRDCILAVKASSVRKELGVRLTLICRKYDIEKYNFKIRRFSNKCAIDTELIYETIDGLLKGVDEFIAADGYTARRG